MNLKILLTVASIYTALVGLGLIFVPLYFGRGAVPADPSVELVHYLRVWAGPLLGISVFDWMSRNAEPSKALTAIVAGNVVGFGSIGLIDLWGLFTGTRELTKLFVVIHLLFAAAFIWAGIRACTKES